MAKTSQPKRNKPRLTKAELSKEIEAKLSTFVNSSTESFALLDDKLNYMFINPTAERMIGVSKEAVVGKNVLDVVPDVRESGRYDKYLNVLKTGEPFFIEDMISHTKFGEIHASLKAFRVESWLGLVFTDITERKQAEEALRESEQRFRLLYERVPFGYQSLNEDGYLIEVNQAWLDLFGFSREEVIGRWFGDFFAPGYQEHFKKNFPRFKAAGEIHGVEYEMLRKDGSKVAVAIDGRIGYDERGKFKQTHCIIQDITERKQVDEILRQSERNYRVLFEGTLDGLFVVSAETGRIVLANRSAAKVFGFSSPEAMIGVYPINFVTPESRNGVLRFVAEDVLSDLSEEVSRSDREVHEIRALANDGREIWLEIQGTPTEYQGKLAYLVSSKDITERKQAEEALRRSEEYFRALIENAQDAIVILNGDGTMRYGSPSIERIWGYKVEDWSDKNYSDFVSPDDMQNAAEAFARLLRNPGSRLYTEMHVRHKDGSIHVVEASGKNLLDNPSINGIVLNVCDITERKQAEESLGESEEKYRNLFSNAQVGLFRSRVADGKIIECNDLLAKMFGYNSREECIAEHVTSERYVDPNARALELRLMTENGEVKDFETLVKRKDGSPFWISYSATIYPERDYIEGVVIDITERKQAEEALKESEERNRALVEAAAKAGTAIGVVQNVGGLEAACVFVNDEFCEMTGYSREELLSMKAQDVINPAEFSDILDKYRRRQRGENAPALYELNVVHKDGTLIPVEAGFSIMTHSGNVATVAFFRNITERKQAEEALRHERDNLLNTLNAMKDGVYIINQQNDIVFANPSTKEEFGSYEGKKCYEYFHDFKEPCSWCDSRAICTGKIVRSEWFFPKTGKTYEVVHTPFREIDGNISKLSIIRDITERKRMEEALRESEQVIRRLAKAAASAHEEERHRVSLEVHDRISQTLTGAFHQLQALESIPIENTEAQQILKRASDLLQESIRESRNIMEDLYSPVLSDFGIMAVIDEELRRFQEETGCRTKFDKICAVRPTPEVELTVYRIFREALANIKRHAVGATEVRVSLSDKAEMVSLQVRDNGPGFDVEAAMLNMRLGGLKGMQRRAELGGGAFEVVSSPGHGTIVAVCLPCTSASDGGKEEKIT